MSRLHLVILVSALLLNSARAKTETLTLPPGSLRSNYPIVSYFTGEMIWNDTEKGPICASAWGVAPCSLVREWRDRIKLDFSDFYIHYRAGQIVWNDSTQGLICVPPRGGAAPCGIVWERMTSLSRGGLLGNLPQLPSQPPTDIYRHNTPLAPGVIAPGRLIEERPWGFCPPPCDK